MLYFIIMFALVALDQLTKIFGAFDHEFGAKVSLWWGGY